ncbi:AraC family transcriptional regulator [Streptomyces sp. SP18CS02]|uniref:AraC family transcriptional regulator n=1 Tax=Streptomyces sp. SP18CS02 TaxID=3002531 RepID=UPI002E76216B|nr:AraC family transcriptional regulator [Streptomyces sp. SP18CS02]MEE1754878.1 AraC family transcriptional regulator [Streptomyces sp. SP18CS02]
MDGASTFRTGDVDEARQEIGARYYANFIDVLTEDRPFAARLDTVRVGPLTIGDLSCGTDVRMRFGELGAYHIDAPLSGGVDWRQGRRPAARATTDLAAVFDPVGDTALDRWGGDCRLLAVKIERDAVRRRLEELLGRSVNGALTFGSGMDISRGPGRDWVGLARWVAGQARSGGSSLLHPLVLGPLQDALLTGLLLALEHPYRDELEQPGQPMRPGPVKRVMDAVQERPEHPFTTTELAALGRVSVRRLQESFREYVGTSPMAYVRDIRLARVHQELRDAEPGTVSVSEAAWRWGFSHLGRFAAQYKGRFGESPSQTLRTGRAGRRTG